MKVLNLYSGLGGNRRLWTDVEVTAIEIREDIAKVYSDYFPDDKLIITDAHQYLLEHYQEFDFIWSSPPCQTHSRVRMWSFKNNNKVEKKYPDMSLYQEIIFLQSFAKCKWVIENVNPYYHLLINPSIRLGRHLFWSNFFINNFKIKEADINRGVRSEWEQLHGFDISGYKFLSRTDQILRNCVHPETGLHILNQALGIINKSTIQSELF